MDELQCTVCEERHPWPSLFFAVFQPRAAVDVPERQRAYRIRFDEERGHVVIDNRHAFLQSDLRLPIQGREETVIFKTWIHIAMPQARFLADRWRQRTNKEPVPPIPGMMNDELPGYRNTLGLRVFLDAQGSEVRPKVTVLENANRLYRDQRDGLDEERLREVASALHHARS